MADPVKKHPCPDCHHCQWCGDDRCRLCLRAAGGCRRKLSVAEQIALYEQLNGAGGCLSFTADASGNVPARGRQP